MKKLVTVLLVLAVALGAAACGQSAPAAFSQKDLSLSVNGTTITAETEAQAILSALGDGYDYAEAVSCVYEGMDRTYTYDTCVLYTYPDGESERLMEISCFGGEVKTSRGITLGASRADVVAAYGEPTSELGSTISYELSAQGENLPAALSFLIRGDAVEEITLTAEHRAE